MNGNTNDYVKLIILIDLLYLETSVHHAFNSDIGRSRDEIYFAVVFWIGSGLGGQKVEKISFANVPDRHKDSRSKDQ